MLNLYKDLIIDHGLNPRNMRVMENFTNSARGFNPFCGDSFYLYLNIIDESIYDISFHGKGCSISTASASLMTVFLKKKNLVEAIALFDYFKLLVKGDVDCRHDLHDLNVLSNVTRFPSRVKCATLIWHTLNDALITRLSAL